MNATTLPTSDRAKALRRRFLVVATILAIADGFDASLVGVTLPVILAKGEFGVTPGTAGAVASAQLLGMLVGAVVAGILADRIGKKKVMLATLILFSVFTLAVSIAPGLTLFLVFRFLAGVGIGGIVPTLIAYVAEFSLRERRFANNTIMLVGTAIGGMLAPLAGLALLAGLGLDFRILWIMGGVFGLLLVPVAVATMPESWAYLQTHGQPQRAASLRARFGLGDLDVPASGDRPQLRTLFTREYRGRTILIAISAMFVIGSSTAFPTWLPQYLVLGGVQFSNALALSALVTFGTIVGCLVGGRMQDRGNPRIVVAVFLLLTGLALVAIGLALGAPFWLILVLLLCYGLVNNPFMFNGLVANVYPPHLRGSILSVDFGVGRAAAVVAAALGGVIAAANLPPAVNFILWALLPLAAALAVFLIPAYRRRDASEGRPASTPSADETVGA
ncbi:MFS transporter [Nocardia sp. NPDC047654]|uniref:MFS transporter n=1 Tax=Nocardia sp. NPDC047654 TaxID=3364314 RepID=UPI00371B2FF0